MKNKNITIFLLILLFNLNFFSNLYSEELLVKIRPYREYNIDITKEYKYMLLDLILSKTEGSYRIEESEIDQVQSRTIKLVRDDIISLIMTMTSDEREAELHPVRIPIYKGLYGYRLFIINKKDKSKFEAINSLSELKQLKAGQGHDWPDVKILEYNGITVITSSMYRGLFRLLQNNSFDYFPRGLTEPWRVVEEEKERDLIVDSHLMLFYPAPVYIFIARDNRELIDRITNGFEAAIEDGSFDHLFNTHPYIQNAIGRARMGDRIIYNFKNPLLSPETPLNKPEYWFVP